MNHNLNVNDYQQYTYCFSKGMPETLVILDPPGPVAALIINIVQNLTVFWVGGNSQQTMFGTIKEIEKQSGLVIYFKHDIQQLKKQIEEKRTTSNIALVVLPEFYQRVIKFCREFPEIRNVICFIEQATLFKFNNSLTKKLLSALKGNKNEVAKILKCLKQESSPNYQKILPNFLFCNDKGGEQMIDSHMIARTINAMVLQKIDKQTKLMIIDELEKVIVEVQKINQRFQFYSNSTRQFLKQLRNQMGLKKTINWYTKQSIVHKLVNNLLRLSRHPSQMFYIQPYFKRLFESVRKLNLLYHSGKKKTICFRGGRITRQEIQKFKRNRYKMVQNLGFLSTTLQLQIAQKFSENAIFEIQIDQSDERTCLSYGFAMIENFSQYYSESEILFNPLNTFRILDTQQAEKQKILIKLKYGPFLQEDQKSAEEGREIIEALCELRQQEQQFFISQGRTLRKQYNSIDEDCQPRGFRQYWMKFLTIVEEGLQNSPENRQLLIQKARGLSILGFYTSKLQEKYSQLQLIKQSIMLSKKVGERTQYLQSLSFFGNIMQKRQHYVSALKIYSRCIKIADQIHQNNICKKISLILNIISYS